MIAPGLCRGFVSDAHARVGLTTLTRSFRPPPGLLPGVARIIRKHPETKILRAHGPNHRQKVGMAQAIPNILVVEDDRETRSLIAKYLRNNACNVTTAADGREMARAMTDRRVDLLILDVMLPGEDGLTPVPQGARAIADPDHHADRARRGRRSHPRPRDGRRRLSGKTVQPARIAGPDQRGAAPAGRSLYRQRHRGRDRACVCGLADRFPAARVAQSGRRARRDDQRRVRPAADILRAARPRAVARQPARPHAGPQRRLVRALDRRAGQPHPPQDRTRSAERHHDQDGALRRLHVHARRVEADRASRR